MASVSELPPVDSPETFAGWHMPWPRFDVDWTRAGLLVIDMQNYGCNPEAGLPLMLSEQYPEIARYYLPRVTEVAVPNARRLLDGFRAAGHPVVFTRHGPLLADGSDMIARRRRRDVEAIEEHRHTGAVAPRHVRARADRSSGAGRRRARARQEHFERVQLDGIEWLLRNLEVETLVLAGIATDMCVETTARDAADRGFNVILVEDATATFFEHHHRAALSGFARVFGQVWDTDDVLSRVG